MKKFIYFLSKNLLAEVIQLQQNIIQNYPKWRNGQAFFNALHSIEPNVANQIRMTEFDMFHESKNIPTFINNFVINELIMWQFMDFDTLLFIVTKVIIHRKDNNNKDFEVTYEIKDDEYFVADSFYYYIKKKKEHKVVLSIPMMNAKFHTDNDIPNNN